MGFATDIAVEISGTGKVQADAATVQPEADLNLRLNAQEIRPFRVVVQRREILTCNRRGLMRRRTTTRHGEMTWRMEATPKLIALMFAWWAGTAAAPTGTDPKTHLISLSSSRVARYFSAKVGFADGSDGRFYRLCSINDIRLSATQGTDAVWQMDVDIVCAADYTADTTTTWGACYDKDPAILSEGAFTINGTSYQSVLQEIALNFVGAIAKGSDPFLNSIDAQRWRRGSRLGYGMTASFAGDTSHALYTAGAANGNNGTEYPVIVRIGPAGDGITFTYPAALVSLQEDQLSFFGELEESSIALMIDPTTDEADATTPLTAAAVLPLAQQSPAFLVAST